MVPHHLIVDQAVPPNGNGYGVPSQYCGPGGVANSNLCDAYTDSNGNKVSTRTTTRTKRNTDGYLNGTYTEVSITVSSPDKTIRGNTLVTIDGKKVSISINILCEVDTNLAKTLNKVQKYYTICATAAWGIVGNTLGGIFGGPTGAKIGSAVLGVLANITLSELSINFQEGGKISATSNMSINFSLAGFGVSWSVNVVSRVMYQDNSETRSATLYSHIYGRNSSCLHFSHF